MKAGQVVRYYMGDGRDEEPNQISSVINIEGGRDSTVEQ